jgi:aquaporin Z
MKMEVSHLSGRGVPAVEEGAKSETLPAAGGFASSRTLSEALSWRLAGRALRGHWPEYLMEAAGLGFFMVSACFFAALIFHPSSKLNGTLNSPLVGRVLMGAMMGLTAVAIIYSPWGKRSGAHINPATTLTFLRLGKVAAWDACLYVLAQFAGGVTGVIVSALLLGNLISDPSVNYVTTLPGPRGSLIAFIAELIISFILMTVILHAANNARTARWTGMLAGVLVATFISIESPLSGMSLNPARTFASAFSARDWTALWVYFTAPPSGMLLAAEVYIRTRGGKRVMCAKLHHQNNQRCIFRCAYKSDQPATVSR